MPNKSSKANFIPKRMCVICRSKKNKSDLIRFVVINKEIMFDFNNSIAARGYYICKSNTCIMNLNKWLKKKNKKNNGK